MYRLCVIYRPPDVNRNKKEQKKYLNIFIVTSTDHVTIQKSCKKNKPDTSCGHISLLSIKHYFNTSQHSTHHHINNIITMVQVVNYVVKMVMVMVMDITVYIMECDHFNGERKYHHARSIYYHPSVTCYELSKSRKSVTAVCYCKY